MEVRELNLKKDEEIIEELKKVEVDDEAFKILLPKFKLKVIKVSGISSPALNILKQDALSCGADVAVPKWAVKCEKEKGNAIITGTEAQLKKLVEKLKNQPFKLKKLAEEIEKILKKDRLKWKLRKRELEMNRTYICGILNVTPDSFYDGGRYFDVERAIDRVYQMIEEGADLIDIGGESTRPGAEPVTEKEELKRVMPVIEKLSGIDVPLSIDTYKSKVAKEALSAGCEIVNDISGLSFDEKMKEVIAEYKAGCIIMHIKGTPKDMQKNPHYEDTIEEIINYLREKIEIAEKEGIDIEKIAIDPGIGFGKRNPYDNLLILKRLKEFKALSRPIFIGVSRKSFIGLCTGAKVEERLPGSIAAAAVAVMNGANIIRTHDVKETKQALKIVDEILNVI